jgi:AcrR family transcriptional regulator
LLAGKRDLRRQAAGTGGEWIAIVAEKKETPLEDQGARTKIIEAAVDLFAENGYAATSVREIVARAGVTKPVLYYYFGSKEGLFQTLFEIATAEHQILINEALAHAGTTIERLTNFFGLVIRKVKERRNFVKMMHGIVFGPRKGVPKCDIMDFRQREILAISRIYREGVMRGEVIELNMETVVHLILSILDSGVVLEFAQPELNLGERTYDTLYLAYKIFEPRGI